MLPEDYYYSNTGVFGRTPNYNDFLNSQLTQNLFKSLFKQSQFCQTKQQRQQSIGMIVSLCILIYFSLENELAVWVNQLQTSLFTVVPWSLCRARAYLSPHLSNSVDWFLGKQEPWKPVVFVQFILFPFALAVSRLFALQRKLIHPF